jgi:hypothetical protein
LDADPPAPALGLLDLAFGLRDIGLRHQQFRLYLLDLAPRGLDRSLLRRAVEPEDRRSLGDWTAEASQERSGRF